MDTSTNRRRSERKRPQVDHFESPIDSPKKQKSVKKSLHPDNAENVEKTPKSKRKAALESPENTPKKQRNRTPSSKALEAVVLESSPTVKKLDTAKKRRSVKSRKAMSSPELIGETSNDSFGSCAVAKPTTLFDDDADVEGQRMFSFRTPSKRDSMAVLAKLTPKTPRNNDSNKRTPKTSKTPKSNHLTEIQNTPTSRPSTSKIAKTPRHVRAATKKSKSSS